MRLPFPQKIVLLPFLLWMLLPGCGGGVQDVCPDGACSDHGTCTTEGLRPVCACDEGYAGVVCSTCETGFHRDISDGCVPDETCSDALCGTNGTCELAGGVARCLCDPGFTGSDCTSCASGFHDDGSGACIVDVVCLPTSCSGRGTCSADGTATSCVCDAGFSGSTCATVLDGCATDPCGDNGSCHGDTGSALCACDLGYTGALCDMCYPGYKDDSSGCVLSQVCEASSCSGAGTCAVTAGVPSCTCDSGYAGSSCEMCAADFHRDGSDACVPDESCVTNDPCGPGGTCDDTTLSVRCICDVEYAGATCGACYPGYIDDGLGACVLQSACLPHTCNGGTCDDTGGTITCSSCPAGYEGDNCEINVDNCVNTGCNTGTCIDLVDDHVCLCLDNTYGYVCP